MEVRGDDGREEFRQGRTTSSSYESVHRRKQVSKRQAGAGPRKTLSPETAADSADDGVVRELVDGEQQEGDVEEDCQKIEKMGTALTKGGKLNGSHRRPRRGPWTP